MDLDAQIDSLVHRLLGKGVNIRPIESAPWISTIEERLGYSYPYSFRSLVTRYSFPYLEFRGWSYFQTSATCPSTI